MCGILATIRPSGAGFRPSDGIRCLAHRGPDAAGTSSIKLPWADVSLSMSRLKIVDQCDLQLPFAFPAFGVSIAFNGELYNWRELRAKLSPADWQTECDAEVVAAAWHKWKAGCLEHFNGMWGFVLVDQETNEIFIARDHAGLKPVFLAQREDTLYVASEAKALPVALEETPCADLEAFEYDFGESTPFHGVQRLAPGCCIRLRGPDVHTRATRWWQLPSVPETEIPTRPLHDVVEEAGALLLDAVKIRAVAEVPAALQLSGGLDSALIYECVKKVDPVLGREIKLYCVSFDQDGIDNMSAARLAAGAERELTVINFDLSALMSVLPDVVYHLDTPATWSSVCLWYLAQRISADGVKIALSGEGADELFGGYTRYRILNHLDRMRADVHLTGYEPTIVHLLGTRSGFVARMLDHSPRGAKLPHVIDLVRSHAGGMKTLLRTAMRTEFYSTMQVLLRMGDRMAAAFSLENRCPFLDYRLIELAASLPNSMLVNEHESKVVLRGVARSLGVHRSIVEEKTKRGLAVPWAKWNPSAAGGLGARGVWDRSTFAALMLRTWRERCLRPALTPDFA